MMKLLEVRDLKIKFYTSLGVAEAVRGISFDVEKGEILGIVGESGSGKSVTGLAIMDLLDRNKGVKVDGEILYKGKNILKMTEKEVCDWRGSKISMIFQEPSSALNPVMSVENQLREVYEIHQPEKAKHCHLQLVDLLRRLHIIEAEKVLKQYPFELSGGMKQRIVIAMSVLAGPELIIADEPTTALDVTTQAEILSLLQEIQKETGCAVIFITHDLGVIAEIAREVMVMYRGLVMERSPVKQFFENAKHPYSKDLLASRLENFDGSFRKIPGSIPDAYEPMEGCAYYGRCAEADAGCRNQFPMLTAVDDHQVRCFRYNGRGRCNE